MIPSALEWFVELCSGHPNAPEAARDLVRDLRRQFASNFYRKQINRVFVRYKNSFSSILIWLNSKDFAEVADEQKSELMSSTYKQVVSSIEKMIAGETPSVAWGMGAQRGRNTGFSETLEAAALANYLSKVPIPTDADGSEGDGFEDDVNLDRLFNRTTAITIAATLFNVNPDNIRKYTGAEAVSDQSEALIALAGLISRGQLDVADKYFDIEELIASANRTDVPN